VNRAATGATKEACRFVEDVVGLSSCDHRGGLELVARHQDVDVPPL